MPRGSPMNSPERNRQKELYRQWRALPWNQLWTDDVARFDRASPEERSERVAVIRAVGVVFSESGPLGQKDEVKRWLLRQLQDPCEKIRRYAMAAMPKIGAGPKEEAELLSLLRRTEFEREKKFLGQALEKIGGTATLETMKEGAPGFLPQTGRKIQARVARGQSPSAIRMNIALSDFAGLRIHLRGRRGLERIVREEVEASPRTWDKFRVAEVDSGLVTIIPVVPFALSDIYALRCFGSVGLVAGTVGSANEAEFREALASVIASPLSWRVLESFTEGPIRYRLNFMAKGHQRGAVRLLADRVYALCPKILNDPQEAPWAIDIYPSGRGYTVELCPKLTPDPRFYYRRQDVPAASHPSVAACLARLAGRVANEIVWDPFCGSGLELIESVLLGGVRSLYGTDRSAAAIAIAQGNFAAAKVSPVQSKFACCDFRDFATIEGLGPKSVTLIITNPPMGKRVPVGNLRGLIEDLFSTAAVVLRPGGRLVFANPLSNVSSHSSLRLQSRQVVDFGGFDCWMERYLKLPAGS